MGGAACSVPGVCGPWRRRRVATGADGARVQLPNCFSSGAAQKRIKPQQAAWPEKEEALIELNLATVGSCCSPSAGHCGAEERFVQHKLLIPGKRTLRYTGNAMLRSSLH